MARFEGVEFGPGDAVMLDEHQFENCVFNGTRLYYAGGEMDLVGCKLIDVRIIFTGAACNTADFIRKIGSVPGGNNWLDCVVRQLCGEMPVEEAAPLRTILH